MGPSVGYEVLVVWCRRCGREAWVAPELWDRGARHYCRVCGSEKYELRRIWHPGNPPGNVVPIKRNR